MRTRIAMIAVVVAAASAAVAAGGVKPLDPNAQDPLHHQIMRATQGERPAPAIAAAEEAVLAEVDAKLSSIETEVARLRAMGESGRARAETLDRRLAVLRDRREGKAIVNDAKPELHVVGVYEGAPAPGAEALPPAQRRRQRPGPQSAVVEVQATGRPIVLAICASERVHWVVRMAKDANVQKVFVGGYHEQDVEGIPDGIPLEKHTYDGKSAHYFSAYGKESDGYFEAIERLRTLTDLNPSTFQGSYTASKDPFIVGPGSKSWMAQRMGSDLESTYREAIAYSLAQQRESLKDLRFKAVRFAPPAPGRLIGGAPGVQVRVGGGTSAAFADFSVAGPIEGTEVPLPGRVNGATFDPIDGMVYSLEMHGVFQIDPVNKRPISLKPNDPALPEVSWPSGLAFDTKRRRLVLSTHGGSGYLYAYDPVAQKWSGLVDLENVDIHSLVYSPAHDCFYALLMQMGDRGAPTRIVRYMPEGDADQLIETPRPLMYESFTPDRVPQLVAVGELLALIPPSPATDRRLMARGPVPAGPVPREKIYLIDPKTGDVKYSGAMEAQPAAGPVKLTDAEIAAAWDELSAEEPADVERAGARLAAAGESTVSFLRGKLTNNDKPADPQRVKGWIAELDAEDFARRDAATRELRRLGREVEPALRDALKAGASAEATVRIEGLLHHLAADLENGQPHDRDGRAIQLLGRIGSPAAIELLAELAAGPDGAPRTDQARQGIQEFARE